MKRGVIILVLGLLLGAGAFAGVYYQGTAWCRQAMNESQPELAWLKKEYHLSDAEFSRIVQLHEAYLPECAKRCLTISEQNQKLEQLLQNATTVTPQVQELLLERAKTRALCEAEMLKHFLAVSRTMPADQGQRYLAWVEQQSFLNGQGMEQRHSPAHHHHPSAGQTAQP